ncbi:MULTISPECIES: hypothetical protein [Rhizobium]|nr:MULTISPECIES: hypothetical protein [Rhizobium]WET72131.1 hypothetical protein PYR68_11455 [Rhizobium croatiense]
MLVKEAREIKRIVDADPGEPRHLLDMAQRYNGEPLGDQAQAYITGASRICCSVDGRAGGEAATVS